MEGLVERIREAIVEFNRLHPDGQDTIEKAKQREAFVKEKAFSPDAYEKFDSLFTKSKRKEDGKIVRYTGTIPDYIYALIDRLSHNPRNSLDVKIGKYVALLIGRREVASMARVEDRYEKKEELYKIVDTITKGLKNFPFYEEDHALHSLRAGRGSGYEGYVPPLKLFSLKKEKTTSTR